MLEEMGSDFLSGATAPGSDGGEEFAGMIRNVADAAPSEIAEDWNTLAKVYDTMSNIDLSDPDAADELDQLGDIDQVGRRIQQHVESECT